MHTFPRRIKVPFKIYMQGNIFGVWWCGGLKKHVMFLVCLVNFHKVEKETIIIYAPFENSQRIVLYELAHKTVLEKHQLFFTFPTHMHIHKWQRYIFNPLPPHLLYVLYIYINVQKHLYFYIQQIIHIYKTNNIFIHIIQCSLCSKPLRKKIDFFWR